ncbi:hypothetical protein Aph01nite_05000 [Acrocarpospora phusangensis]|uniref:CU044_5270 family protein n=1 Tax=Acrocarpospora phusangensis TaxID=1070424 RepID=A0A919UMY4_9ACTN|nr:hypothetical protein Aph01nite_05000 [Acrocarpospora phusangensis]
MWGFGLAGAAAVAAVAVFTSGTGVGTVTGGPAGVTAAAPSGSGSFSSEPVPLSARQLLLVAATSADKEPATTGKFWFTKTASRDIMSVDGDYALLSEGVGESWLTDGQQWHTSQSLGTKPATEADQAAWEAAGSPTTAGVGEGKRLETVRPAGKPSTDTYKSKYVYWLGRNVTLDQMRALPADPAKLKASLLKYYTGNSTEADVPMAEDNWLFTVAGGLVIGGPVSPQVRAAAFRMLAALPSVTSLGQVTDSTGRPGTAIGIETSSGFRSDPDKGVLQERLIIDEKSGRALAREYVVVKPGGFQKGLKPGTVSNSTTIVDSGWTDTRTS